MSPTSALFFPYTRRRPLINKEKRLRCHKHHQKRKGHLHRSRGKQFRSTGKPTGNCGPHIPIRESFTTISYLRFYLHQAFILICIACLCSSFLLGSAQSVYITTFHGYTRLGFLGLSMGSPRPEFCAVYLALLTSYGILIHLRKCDSVHHTSVREHVWSH
jgi:hypothetical protein